MAHSYVFLLWKIKFFCPFLLLKVKNSILLWIH